METKRQLKPPPPPPNPEGSGPLDYVPISGEPLHRPIIAHSHKILYVVLTSIIILLLAGGVAGYWFMTKKRAPSASTGSNTQQSSSSTPQVAGTATPSSMVQYTSNGNDLNLSFTYPSTWTVTPPTNSNPNDKPVTLTSPIMSMVNSSDATVTGRIVIGIYPGGTSLPELASDKATSAAASVQFAYTKPTPAQHQYPYLSFIHLSGGTNTAGIFEEAVITGITSFAKDQTILPESLTMIDPLITARFYQCSSQACNAADSAPLGITMSAWQNNDAFSQVQAIFASMQMH